MFTKRLLGIVFTPSWLRIAYVELSRNRIPTVRAYGVPLPVGCINEDSGTVEDSGALQQAMKSVSFINRRYFRPGGVFLVVPQLLCYRTALVVPPERGSVFLQQILEENVADLPGDRSSLVVDAYADAPRSGEARAVMVLAARRVAIEAYTRLFGEDAWCIGGITTGEVARFNRWKLQHPEVQSKVVLVCGADMESRELSIWNRGVLTASDTRYWRQRSGAAVGARQGAAEYLGEKIDLLAHDIMASIERQRGAGEPVECVYFGGALRGRSNLRDRIEAASGVHCLFSTSRGLFEAVPSLGITSDSGLSDKGSESGLYDDAIGAIAPVIASLNGRSGGSQLLRLLLRNVECSEKDKNVRADAV